MWTTKLLLLQRESKMLSSGSKIFVSDKILVERQQFLQQLAAGVLLFELFELDFDLDLTKSIFQYCPPSWIQTEMISKNFTKIYPVANPNFLPSFVFVFYQAIYIGLVDQRYTSSCYHRLFEPFHWQYLVWAVQYIDLCEEIVDKNSRRFPL